MSTSVFSTHRVLYSSPSMSSSSSCPIPSSGSSASRSSSTWCLLSTRDLSQAVLVSKRYQGVIQSILYEDPLPSTDLIAITHYNGKSSQLLEEMEENFDVNKTPPLKDRVDTYNRWPQPLRYFHLQILAAQLCIRTANKFKRNLVAKLERDIARCDAIRGKQFRLHTFLQSEDDISLLDDENPNSCLVGPLLEATIDGFGRARRSSPSDENYRKTLALTENLLNLGLKVTRINGKGYSARLIELSSITFCLRRRAVRHLNLLIERGSPTSIASSVDTLTPLMSLASLDSGCRDPHLLAQTRKTLDVFFQSLPDPFKKVTIRIIETGFTSEEISAEEYMFKKESPTWSIPHIVSFNNYKRHYREILDTLNRGLPIPQLPNIVLSYIRS